ncbi:MAG: tripartite tricarboxylate transporter TctB family protein, partial [Burkholderiaceae bacterium]
MLIRNQKDFWSGVMFAAFGLFFAGFGTRYTFGSAARMGPGYFPTVLGVILI